MMSGMTTTYSTIPAREKKNAVVRELHTRRIVVRRDAQARDCGVDEIAPVHNPTDSC